MTIGDIVQTYCALLAYLGPVVGPEVVTALIVRDAESRWWSYVE